MGARSVLVLLSVVVCSWNAGLGRALSIGGVCPDLALTFIICAGVIAGPETGAATGLLCGVIQAGQLGSEGLGALLVSRMVAGLGAGYLGARVFSANAIAPLLCAAVATLMAEAAYFLMAPYPLFRAWLQGVLQEALYNGVAALAMHRALAWVLKRVRSEPAPHFIGR